jgi:transposase-like protein
MIGRKLAIVNEARAAGHTAADAANLVGWSRATLYRHQAAVVRSVGEEGR